MTESYTKRKRSWKDVKTYDNDKGWDAELDFYEYSSSFKKVRLIGDYFVAVRHWVNFMPKNGKKVKVFPVWCPNFNPVTEKMEDHGCPYCDIGVYAQRTWFSYCIDREMQEEQPKKSPIKVIRFGVKVANQIKGIIDLNTRKIDGQKMSFGIEDEKHGCDVFIKYDEGAQGTDKYQIQIAEQTSLTEAELEYKLADLAAMYKTRPVSSLAQDLERLTITDRDGNVMHEPSAVKKTSTPQSASLEDDDEDDVPVVSEDAPEVPEAEPEPVPASAPKVEAPPKPEPKAEAPKEAPKVEAKDGPPGMAEFLAKQKLSPKDHDGITVPSCFAAYEGKLKCFSCPVKKDCAELTEAD